MNAAIILSGGNGTRLGTNIPKQYINIKGKSILEYSIQNFFLSDQIDIVIIVVANLWLRYVKDLISNSFKDTKQIVYAESGETRQLSIFNGLKAIDELKADIDKVIIHDAARPMISKRLIEDCLSNIEDEYEGVMPVIPMKDTVYISNDGKKIDRLLDRSQLYAGQAPEAFKYDPYLNAHKNMTEEDIQKIKGSSELAYLIGMRIKMIPGDPTNFKITDSSDLERFKSSLL